MYSPLQGTGGCLAGAASTLILREGVGAGCPKCTTLVCSSAAAANAAAAAATAATAGSSSSSSAVGAGVVPGGVSSPFRPGGNGSGAGSEEFTLADTLVDDTGSISSGIFERVKNTITLTWLSHYKFVFPLFYAEGFPGGLQPHGASLGEGCDGGPLLHITLGRSGHLVNILTIALVVVGEKIRLSAGQTGQAALPRLVLGVHRGIHVHLRQAVIPFSLPSISKTGFLLSNVN